MTFLLKKTYSGSGATPPELIPLHRNNTPPVPTYFFERCAAPEHNVGANRYGSISLIYAVVAYKFVTVICPLIY
jgi:hypothetical protein